MCQKGEIPFVSIVLALLAYQISSAIRSFFIDPNHYDQLQQSSIVVTGVPTKSYRLPSAWIQENTTVVNVASFKNVDESEILQIPGVTYVPMVGKVTGQYANFNISAIFSMIFANVLNDHLPCI